MLFRLEKFAFSDKFFFTKITNC